MFDLQGAVAERGADALGDEAEVRGPRGSRLDDLDCSRRSSGDHLHVVGMKLVERRDFLCRCHFHKGQVKGTEGLERKASGWGVLETGLDDGSPDRERWEVSEHLNIL